MAGTVNVSLVNSFAGGNSIVANDAGTRLFDGSDPNKNYTVGNSGSTGAVYTFNEDLGSNCDAYNAAISIGSDHAWTVTTGTKSNDTVYGGAGNDTLISANGADVFYGGAGKDYFEVSTTSANTVTIKDFTYGEDKLVIANQINANAAGASNVAAVFKNTGVVANAGANGASYDITASKANDFYKATVVDYAGASGANTYNVWFGSDTAAVIDGRNKTSSLLMVGNNNDVADSLYGGSGKDTIMAGKGDVVDGGAGSDELILNESADVVVGFASTSGKDNVTGYNSSDSIWMYDTTLANAKYSYNSTNSVANVTIGSSKLTISDGVVKDGNAAALKIKDSTGTTYNTAVLAEAADTTFTVASNLYEAYVGTGANATLNFNSASSSVITDGMSFDLGNTNQYGDTASYSGIKALVGTAYNDTIIGAAATSESLSGGAGSDSIWGGGASNDTMFGGNGGVDASASDTFFFTYGDGKDVVGNFVVGATADNDKADVLALKTNLTDINSIATTNKGTESKTVFTLNTGDTITLNGNEQVTAGSSADYQLSVNGTSVVAKVGVAATTTTGATLKTDEYANYYIGTSLADTVEYTSTDTDTTGKVYLDGRNGLNYNSIENVSGGDFAGNVELGGDTKSNTITGGKGTSTLWGGAGAVADTLVGGTNGNNTYFYGAGEGNDVITTTSASDKVMLYNINESDLKSAAVSSGVMTITTNAGSTLTIKNYTAASVNDFVLGDGTEYTYSYADKKFTKVTA